MRLFRNLLFILSFISIGLFIIGCKENKAPLDIAEYLSYANSDTIYPSEKQIEILKAVMPEDAYQIAPSISNRKYWDNIANSESGEEYIAKAESNLNIKPEVPISDEIYRRANKEGNRKIYKPRYYRTMERLENFMLAECIENEGRFLPQISDHIRAIMEMKSWIHPNHDDRNNSNLEGKTISIDLGARKFGSVLSLALVLLEDNLPAEFKAEIHAILQKRITQSYLESCMAKNRQNSWIRSTSNWNSVCTSGSVFTIVSTSESAEERLAAIGSAINSMKFYLSGFGEDGYCSEGVGYWGYGFGNYLYMAQFIYDYSGGSINFFHADNPTKMKNVGNFPENFQIQNDFYANFADGNTTASKDDENFPYILSAIHFDAQRPFKFGYEQAVEQLLAWSSPEIIAADTNTVKQELNLPNSTYFDQFGMVISRGKQAVPLSIAVKAGHNAENHNHSDVGTYTILFDKDFITGDIGAPSYMAGSFSPTNKARSSWGHPVPIIDGILQSNGRKFRGKITETSLTDQLDKVVMDIKAAYEIPALDSLVRTFVNDKIGNGTISIEDKFITSIPVTFGIAIMTFSKYEIIDSNSLILTSKNQKLKVDIESTGGSIKLSPELVPVEHLRNGKDAIRIGINFTKPLTSGSILVKYSPFIDL